MEMVEDKECPKCSTTNSPDNKFCKECGTPLPDESEITAETQNQNLEEIQGSKSNTSKESEIEISNSKKSNKKEDPVESLMDTGKDIMEGIGGFINKATESRETESYSPGDGLSINGMISEERVGFSGQHSTDMQQATVTLTDDKLVIKKKSFLGESDRGEKHIRYEDITTVDLDKKVLLTPGAIQIYTNSGQFTIRKNKAHKLEPFFKNLSKKVIRLKK